MNLILDEVTIPILSYSKGENNNSIKICAELKEDKYKDMQVFANAWVLILNNLIKMTGDKNKILESSTYTVSKLLKIEENFSRLIYMSELLLNCYDYNKKKEIEREDYQLSKMYIDKMIGNDEDKDK